jgi:hypothetical protein
MHARIRQIALAGSLSSVQGDETIPLPILKTYVFQDFDLIKIQKIMTWETTTMGA